jgi:hypothetical protein
MSASQQERTVASANHVTRKLSSMLQNLALQAGTTNDRKLIEQIGLSAIILGATCVEAFVNVFFRTMAPRLDCVKTRKIILEELAGYGSNTRKKLSEWTELAFGRAINTSDERWIEYDNLVNARNAFVHFKSTHETATVPDILSPIYVHGLADISIYENLSRETPENVLGVVVGVVELVEECHDPSGRGGPAFVHHWLGRLDE